MLEFISHIAPWFWLGVLIICCVIEAITLGLTTIWAAIAALPMIFIARTGLEFKWQILIFALVTVVLIIFTRPFVVKKLRNGKEKTNVNTMVGEEVLVTKAITKFQKGEAKAKNGVVWTVQAAEGIEEIPENSVCKITEVQGNTLVISL